MEKNVHKATIDWYPLQYLRPHFAKWSQIVCRVCVYELIKLFSPRNKTFLFEYTISLNSLSITILGFYALWPKLYPVSEECYRFAFQNDFRKLPKCIQDQLDWNNISWIFNSKLRKMYAVSKTTALLWYTASSFLHIKLLLVANRFTWIPQNAKIIFHRAHVIQSRDSLKTLRNVMFWTLFCFLILLVRLILVSRW